MSSFEEAKKAVSESKYVTHADWEPLSFLVESYVEEKSVEYLYFNLTSKRVTEVTDEEKNSDGWIVHLYG